MGLISDIGPGPVALDTVTFIYFMEDHARFAPVLAEVFTAIDEGTLSAVTSAVTLLETLVVPLRENNDTLAQSYEALLTRSKGLELLTLDNNVLRAAAMLRAHTGIKTPDALQLTAALQMKCSAFVTNDRRLPKLRGLRILQLSDY